MDDVPLRSVSAVWDHNAPSTQVTDGWPHRSGAVHPGLRKRKILRIWRKPVRCRATVVPESYPDLTVIARQTREEICEQQPQPVAFPRTDFTAPRPSTSYSTKSIFTLVANGWDAASQATTRASMSIKRPKTADSHHELVISEPTDFRKVDGAPIVRRRREEFRPLELSIYLPNNRLSPLPDFSKSEWTAKPVDLEIPRPAMLRSMTELDLTFSSSTFGVRRKPVESASFLISPSVPDSSRSSLSYETLPQDRNSTSSTQLPAIPSRIHSSPLIRSGTQSSTISSEWTIPSPKSPGSLRSRAVSEPGGLSRRKSTQSRRNHSDVDEAIRELNTIVEERRADTYPMSTRQESATDEDEEAGGHSPAHVPAIAPSMKMRVRTETLSDIGSALSLPHSSKALPPPPLPLFETHTRQISSSSHNSVDVLGEPLRSPPSRSSTRARLTNWIRTSLPFSPTEMALGQLDIKSLPTLPIAFDLPPATPPYFQTTHRNTGAHPLYSCPPTTPPRQSFSTVTASPHSSIQSSPSKMARTVATSVTEVDFDSSGRRSFEAGFSVSSALENEKTLANKGLGDGIFGPNLADGLAERVVNVGLAY